MKDKDDIRRELRARRKAVSAVQRAEISRSICAKLLARADVRRAFSEKRPIAVYLASPEEIDLTDFIDEALAQGAALVAPRWNGTAYELVRLDSFEDLVAGPHGILEPRCPSRNSATPQPCNPYVWLVPGLAFTASGKRLGYGGGWYDRFLAASDAASVKLGVAYGFQVLDDLPSEPHDRLLTEVVV